MSVTAVHILTTTSVVVISIVLLRFLTVKYGKLYFSVLLEHGEFLGRQNITGKVPRQIENKHGEFLGRQNRTWRVPRQTETKLGEFLDRQKPNMENSSAGRTENGEFAYST